MTDKKIIIDGVDVSGCELFLKVHEDTSYRNMEDWEYAENWCKCFYDDCKKYPNCYYKQLKRTESELACKEQECETLKDENFHLQKEGKKSCAYCVDLIAKEQECERLKKEVEFYTTPVKLGDYKPITLIIEELDQLKADNKHLNDLLNQALKELEELQNLKDEDSLRVVILARENEQLKNRINNFVCSENCYKYKEAQSYKQAIEKIKEISNRIYSEVITENWQSLLAKQILQICDEVENDNA